MNAADAAWVLLTSGGSRGDVVRFSKDLAYVYEALCTSGVDPAQIRVLVDDPLMPVVLANEGVPPAATDLMANAANVFVSMRTSGFVGVVVSGHGDHQAIAMTQPVRSTELLRWMASVKGAVSGALVLGQCFAGVFRYVDARSPLPVVIMGATNFEASFSASGVPKRRRVPDWLANPFLTYFADWLETPVDVDGDGQFTILDAYRHISVKTMGFLNTNRLNTAMFFKEHVLDLRIEWENEEDPVRKAAIFGELEGAVSLLFGRPEPWIMGADEARKQHRG